MTLADKVRKIIQTISAYVKISEQKFREMIYAVLFLGFVVLILGFVPSMADKYTQLIPENIPYQNATTLLSAMMQAEAGLLAAFGFIFVAILTIIQSHIELARREIAERHLSDNSPEGIRLNGLFANRDYVLFLMAFSVFSLVVSVFFTLANLASVGPNLSKVDLRNPIIGLLFAIFFVFLGIGLALRVRE
jgi:hypothetical protein